MVEMLRYLITYIPSRVVDLVLYFFNSIDVVDFVTYVVIFAVIVFIAWLCTYAVSRLQGGSRD